MVQRGVRIMYVLEEKIKITEAFLESGLTLAHAGRRPGWPCRRTLSQWVREVSEGKLAVQVTVPKEYDNKRVRHEHYSEETKAKAVKLYEMGRRPVEIARLLGISCPGNVRVWWEKACGRKAGGSPFKPKPLSSGREVVALTARNKVPPEVAALSEVELENACLRAVLADLKAEGWDLGSISNRKKVELGEKLRQETGCALRRITAFLKISKSSYEYHVKAVKQPDKHASIREKIKELFWVYEGTYGYRRIWAEMRNKGIRVSEKVVRRIMQEEGLVVFGKKQHGYNSFKGDISPEVANLVKRNFHADAPNVLWLTDLTEFSIPAGKIYLSPILDCFDGALPSWTIGTSPSAELVNTMLDFAIATLDDNEHPIVHSDQGCHYRWPGWIERMEVSGLSRSMSKKGCSPDNSACEGLFGRIKNEFFYGRDWRGVSTVEFINRLDKYLHWYNEKRIKKSLGYLSPLQYRISLGLVS
jgi:transposase InsO family protein/transposase-like protein